jgi:Hint domain
VITVSDALGLNEAIQIVDDATQRLAADGVTGESFTIDLANSITLTQGLRRDLTAINLGGNSTLTIDGGGNTLDGGSTYQGLFAYQGIVNVDSLTIADAKAKGGAGGSGSAGAGGGGAGLGGGLFVGPSAEVTLSYVSFANDAADGGAGGVGGGGTVGAGGGGGLGGKGGSGTGTGAYSAGGGGIGAGASGGSGSGGAGGPGIVPGAGSGANGAGAGNNGSGGPSAGGGGAGFSNGGGGGIGVPAGTQSSGGFGGGGGASYGHPVGLKGGYGGGGGGSGIGDAGSGGYGGGGGGKGGRGTDGLGGFGGGSGSGHDGGGGLGAGGDVFVAAGGTLVVQAGSLDLGVVQGGTASGGAGTGDAFGSGLFIDGYTTVTLDPGLGQTLTIGGRIGDDDGSVPPPVPSIGRGGLLLDGGGTVFFETTNTYTAGTTITSGTTLNLSTTGGLGSGALYIEDAGDLSSPGPVPNQFGALDGVFDNTSLPTGGSGGQVFEPTNGVDGFAILPGVTLGNVIVAPDGKGGTEYISQTITVTDDLGLNAAIGEIDQASQSLAAIGTFASFTIDLANNIKLTNALTADLATIDLGANSSLTLDGQGFTIDGGGDHRGLSQFGAGTVTIQNLTVADATAGKSSNPDTSGDGGGLYSRYATDLILNNATFTHDSASNGSDGYGGGAYITSADTVSLTNVSFTNDTAGGPGDSYGYGGGAYINIAGTLTLESVVANGDTAGGDAFGYGGGLNLYTGSLIATGVTADNDVASGGSAYAYGGGVEASSYQGNLSFTGLSVNDDTASGGTDGFGGGADLYASQGNVIATGVTATGDTASGGRSAAGGGVEIDTVDGNIVASGVTLDNDVANGGSGYAYGGGAEFDPSGGTTDLSGVFASGNTATGGTSGQGGDIWAGVQQGFTLSGGTLAPASASEGDSLYLSTGSPAVANLVGSPGQPLVVGGQIFQGGSPVTLDVSGGGTVTLGGNNTYTGGTDLTQGTDLVLGDPPPPPTFLGTGTVSIDDAAIVVTPGTFVAGNTITALDGVLDDTTLAYASGATYSLGGGVLTISSGGSSDSFAVSTGSGGVGGPFVVAPDGFGGTEIVSQTIVVSDDAGLNRAISEVDVATQALGSIGASANFTIDFANTITLTNALSNDLAGVVLGAGSTLTIDGGGNTLDGAGTHRGLFAYQGDLNVKNLTIADASAIGGAGGNGLDGGGGGAGLGGGLFVASSADVGLWNVYFSHDNATGGAGGQSNATLGVGGGGGLGGPGGSSRLGEGGGGGVGLGAFGGGTVSNGGGGILPGASAAAGGHATAGSGGGAGGPSAGGGGVGALPTGTVAAYGYGGGGGAGASGDKGGFGGGGGGFTNVIQSGTTTVPGYTGGTGGFGGGGGGSTDGAGRTGGAGGFGGGGGGAFSGGQGGKGGFGAGTGGGGDGGFTGTQGTRGGGGGGGGLGAGGDIFVQAGGSLVYHTGTAGYGGATGGTGGGGSAGFGQGYGQSVFIQGYDVATLDPGLGQTLTIDGQISDEDGSSPAVVSIGRGGVLAEGGGSVTLTGDNNYTNGTDITQGTTLVLSSEKFLGPISTATGEVDNGAAGIGTIDIDDAATVVTPGTFSAGNTITKLDGVLDDSNLAYGSGASYGLGGGALTITSGGFSDTFAVSPGVSGPFYVASDGAGGTEVIAQTITVTDDLGLNAAIREVDLASQTTGFAGGNFTIDLVNNITLTSAMTSDLTGVVLGAGSTLTIDGGGNTLDGAGTYRGLFAYQGNLDVQNLTIADAHAVGGAGGEGYGGAGGGAGLGGGLFVGASADVTLSNVNFANDAATGGAGGNAGEGSRGAGGGGLGGPGGNTSGGGGGVGLGAAGGTLTFSQPRPAVLGVDSKNGSGSFGSPGILPGAGTAGSGFYGGFGGASGGGGGAGADGAGGGGPGGRNGFEGVGGQGAFGGGGGGAFSPGAGGFGGGGGVGAYGGAGGFGGGGGGSTGGTGGTPGFGGGYGSYGGGGGLGAGGDVFVQHGGVLVIQSGSIGAGFVTGGSGGTGGQSSLQTTLLEEGGGSGGYGSAFGDGFFIQGNEAITLQPGAGQTLQIDGNIADVLGSGGSDGSGGGDTGGLGGSGTLILDGLGAVVLNADNEVGGPTGGLTGNIYIESGTLDLAAFGAAGSGNIVFGGSTDPLVVFAVQNTPTNEIDNFGTGDTIVVTGFVATGSSYTNGTLTLGGAPPVNLDMPGLTFADVLVTVNGVTNTTTVTIGTPTPPPCFALGTRIRTARGEVAVEALRAGDEVIGARDGTPKRVRWIGRRRLKISAHPEPTKVWPLRVAAGAFGPRMPSRALFLSPDHAVWCDGELIPVKYLIDGDAIRQVACEEVTYFHVELERHDVLLAEGLPAESYLDTGDRDTFDNGGLPLRLHPAFAIRTWEAAGCAPLVVTGPEVERVRAVIAARADRAARRRARRRAA